MSGCAEGEDWTGLDMTGGTSGGKPELLQSGTVQGALEDISSISSISSSLLSTLQSAVRQFI